MNHLSVNGKGLTVFDISRKKANCQNSCKIKSVCYINNNIQDKLNKAYKNKMARNWKLINSKKFVKVMAKEIKSNNIMRIRFYGNGDLFYGNMDKSIYQLENIVNLCKVLKFNRFWLITRNFDTLTYYFENLKGSKPDNLNIMLSVDFQNLDFVKPICDKHKIQLAYITDKKIDSNCKSSINHKSCIENNCDLCFSYSKLPRIWLIHGKGNKDKFKKLRVLNE